MALAGCARATEGTDTTTSPTAPSEPTASPTIQNIMDLPPFSPLEPGTYFIDPDADPSTPLRVVYEVPAEGWSMWIGAAKSSDDGHVGVSITTVTNLVRHGCRDHSPADPPVRPSVDDLATALADLAPFKVTSPPMDVTAFGYRGKHLELTVPDLPVEGQGDDRSFAQCVGGNLESWIAPEALGGAFYGYNAEPGRIEEFWILDIEGTRLMIEAKLVARFAAEGCRRDAGHPRLHPDRAMTPPRPRSALLLLAMPPAGRRPSYPLAKLSAQERGGRLPLG
jgi:hypothetical protein